MPDKIIPIERLYKVPLQTLTEESLREILRGQEDETTDAFFRYCKNARGHFNDDGGVEIAFDTPGEGRFVAVHWIEDPNDQALHRISYYKQVPRVGEDATGAIDVPVMALDGIPGTNMPLMLLDDALIAIAQQMIDSPGAWPSIVQNIAATHSAAGGEVYRYERMEHYPALGLTVTLFDPQGDGSYSGGTITSAQHFTEEEWAKQEGIQFPDGEESAEYDEDEEDAEELRESTPEDDVAYAAYEAAVDGMESLILALGCAGVDLADVKVITAIHTAYEAIGNHY